MIRMIGAGRRVLPSFIIVGVQKGGTTSLHWDITAHPQVVAASVREVHYFDIHYRKGALWYRGHFPFPRRDGSNDWITGEGSPYYLFHPHAIDRIARSLPRVKLIMLLRNPVKRAISHYYHEVRAGSEKLPIMEALETEERRIEPEYEKMLQNEYYHSTIYRRFSYKKRGVYADQVQACLQRFPADQLLILKSEDLFSQTERILREVFEFLGVDPALAPGSLGPKNVGTYAHEVPTSATQYLTDYFAPHNQRLYELLNRDFQW